MTEPTPSQKLLYYTLGLTPSVVSRQWVERDLQTVGWRIRLLAQYWIGSVVGIAIIAGLVGALSPGPWHALIKGSVIGMAIGGFIGGLLRATVLANYVRRRTLAYYEKRWARQLNV